MFSRVVMAGVIVMGAGLPALGQVVQQPEVAGGQVVATTRPTTRPVEGGWLWQLADEKDGQLDLSRMLSTSTGFLPIVQPITEPAVGFGLAAGLVFFHEKPAVRETPDGPRITPPTATVLFGMATENGSYAVGGGHLHVWDEGRIRYVIGGGYASLNLDWFGQGNALGGRAVQYNLEAKGLFQKLTFKLGESDFYAGPLQRLISTESRLRFDGEENLPGLGISKGEYDANSSALGAHLGYDTRNSLFSPTQGTKASLSYFQNDEVFGSDFNYGRLETEICQYVPLGYVGERPLTLGLRGSLLYASENAPFYDLASVGLRGIQAGRYTDNAALMLEAELRYDFTQRWTVLGFGGAGWTGDQLGELFDEAARPAGGAGIRYLIARQYDLRMGLDVARGPEDWTVYVSVGTGWVRD